MKRRPNAGFTLIEVVVGMLLIALMVGPLFSVALTARTSKARVDKKTAAAIAGSRLLDRLKLYVAEPSVLNDYPGPAPGTSPNGWGLPGDACNCYALSPGTHKLDAATYLDKVSRDAGGKISYTVTNVGTAGGITQPNVTLTITWDQPKGGVGTTKTMGTPSL